MLWCWCAFFVIACGGAPKKPASEVPAGERPVELPAAPGVPASMPSPQALYEKCFDRVEMPQADDECATDADCAVAGCSREVCTTESAAAAVVTTCEGRICFSVLDACGCRGGRCSWTLLDKVPDVSTPILRPPAPGPLAPKPGAE